MNNSPTFIVDQSVSNFRHLKTRCCVIQHGLYSAVYAFIYSKIRLYLSFIFTLKVLTYHWNLKESSLNVRAIIYWNTKLLLFKTYKTAVFNGFQFWIIYDEKTSLKHFFRFSETDGARGRSIIGKFHAKQFKNFKEYGF